MSFILQHLWKCQMPNLMGMFVDCWGNWGEPNTGQKLQTELGSDLENYASPTTPLMNLRERHNIMTQIISEGQRSLFVSWTNFLSLGRLITSKKKRDFTALFITLSLRTISVIHRTLFHLHQDGLRFDSDHFNNRRAQIKAVSCRTSFSGMEKDQHHYLLSQRKQYLNRSNKFCCCEAAGYILDWEPEVTDNKKVIIQLFFPLLNQYDLVVFFSTNFIEYSPLFFCHRS